MPNMHDLIDSMAQIITNDVPGKVWFTSLDLKYDFSQLPLSSLTSLVTSVSCVEKQQENTDTEMPTEFQKALGCTLEGSFVI